MDLTGFVVHRTVSGLFFRWHKANGGLLHSHSDPGYLVNNAVNLFDQFLRQFLVKSNDKKGSMSRWERCQRYSVSEVAEWKHRKTHRRD